ncbi:MAG TPA: EpsI family protein, partial [Paracoccaceae bacterium]|nr:EpsI family protein [Paracoccaceae bacterium]
TIYIAQSQGIEFAVGFDHIFYGWVFFALVMALLLALAWPFFDRSSHDPFIDGQAIASSPILTTTDAFAAPVTRCLVAATLLALGFATWSAQARQVEAVLLPQIALPQVEGWQAVEPSGLWWEPRAAGADHRLLGFYRDAAGAQVDVFLAVYAAQAEGREAGAFGEGALMPGTDWRWHSRGPDFAAAAGGGISERLRAGDFNRLTLTLYRHRDLLTGSVARLKLSNMADRLTFDPHPTTMLILSASEGGPVPAEDAIRRFLASTGDAGEWMDRIASAP